MLAHSYKLTFFSELLRVLIRRDVGRRTLGDVNLYLSFDPCCPEILKDLLALKDSTILLIPSCFFSRNFSIQSIVPKSNMDFDHTISIRLYYFATAYFIPEDIDERLHKLTKSD